MIKSMTGYGRSQALTDGMNISVEIRSVNNRYFDFSARYPRVYGFLEDKLKTELQKRISRGKVECFVQIEMQKDEDIVVELNEGYAESYYAALKKLSEKFGIPEDISVSVMAKAPDMFRVCKKECDEEKIWNAVNSVLSAAIDSFIAMREAEGEKLKADLLSKADFILENVAYIEQRSPKTVDEYKERLESRIRDLLSDRSFDETRLMTEVALFADKVAVDEETVRLRSHISQLHSFLESREPIGRKLDFLVQEMNRETNTIGSKACDTDIANHVIAMKAEIEKIREQVQNIE